MRSSSSRAMKNSFLPTRWDIWTLNNWESHESITHAVTQNSLMMGLHGNAWPKKCAYYFCVFSPHWSQLRHVMKEAAPENSIIKLLNYNVSAIHLWYWLANSVQISHRVRTWTWQPYQPCPLADYHVRIKWSSSRRVCAIAQSAFGTFCTAVSRSA